MADASRTGEIMLQACMQTLALTGLLALPLPTGTTTGLAVNNLTG